MSCPDSTTASTALTDALAGPAKVSGDAGSVEQHPVEGLIAADRYLAAKCAAGNRGRGLRFGSLVPGGTVVGRRRTHSDGGWNRGF